MVRRRPPARGPVQIDLSADSAETSDGGTGADGDVPGAAGADREPVTPGWFARRVAGPLAARWRGLTPRTRAGAAAVTGIAVVGAVAGVAVVDARADDAHAAHMAAMPGGVADLSVPLRESWRVETDAGMLAVLPDGVVVTRDGRDLIALDAATGERRWSHGLGPWPTCGPGPTLPGESARPTDRVVCLEGEDDRTAVTVAVDGTELGRRVVEAPEGVDELVDLGGNGSQLTWTEDSSQVRYGVRPGPEGSVALVPQAFFDFDAESAAAAVDRLAELRQEAGGRLAVSLLDAVTGEQRGELVPSLATADDLQRCSRGRDVDDRMQFTVDALSPTSASGVSLLVCNGWSSLLPDGSEVAGYALPRPGGGWFAQSDDGTRLLDADGEGDVTVPGAVLSPIAADSAGGPVIARDPNGGVAAFDPTGERLWSADVGDVGGIPVQAGGVAVLLIMNGGTGATEVRALDLATGELRWSRDDLPLDYWAVTPGGALTDGSLALLPQSGDTDGTPVVAIDLADGSTRWEAELPGSASLLAVDGAPFLADRFRESYAEQDDDRMVQTSDSALVGLTG